MRYIKSFLALLFLVYQFSHANADWREDIEVFRIGVLAGDDVSATLARTEAFRRMMENVLKTEVEILPAKDYSTLIDAQIGGRLEYAIYSAGAYATAFNLCQCIEPIAVAAASDQTKSYRAAIIAAQDGPKNPGEIDLGRFGITDPATIGATSFALHTLKLGGSDFTGQKEISVSRTSDELLEDFLSGKLNAILGWSSFTGDASKGYSRGTLKRIAEKTNGQSIGYKAIWKSLPIPHGPHAVLKKLPREVKTLLQRTLKNLNSKSPQAYDAIEPEFSGGFLTAKHSDYMPMIRFIQAIKKQTGQGQQ